MCRSFCNTVKDLWTDFKNTPGIIKDIIDVGTSASPDPVWPNPPALGIDTVNSKNILLANKEFIQAEVIAYVDQNNDTLVYDDISEKFVVKELFCRYFP